MPLPTELRDGLRLPVCCAPMARVCGPELVGAACRSGVMAVLPRHNAHDLAEFECWLEKLAEERERSRSSGPRRRPHGPLAVNLSSDIHDRREIAANLEVCARYGVRVIITAMGDPTARAEQVREWGGLIFHDVTDIRFAEKAARAGVDGMICIASGGGGHSGTLSALTLISKVRHLFGGTIVLAGAISSGAAVRAAEVLGADLAYIGTRFIATAESRASAEYKQMLLSAAAKDLSYTPKVSGVAANWLVPSLTRAGVDLEAIEGTPPRRSSDHLPDGVRAWRDLWSAGQGVELVDDLPTVAQLVDRLAAEYRDACAIPAWPGSI